MTEEKLKKDPADHAIFRATLKHKKLCAMSGNPPGKYLKETIKTLHSSRGKEFGLQRWILLPSGKYIPAGPYKNTKPENK